MSTNQDQSIVLIWDKSGNVVYEKKANGYKIIQRKGRKFESFPDGSKKFYVGGKLVCKKDSDGTKVNYEYIRFTTCDEQKLFSDLPENLPYMKKYAEEGVRSPLWKIFGNIPKKITTKNPDGSIFVDSFKYEFDQNGNLFKETRFFNEELYEEVIYQWNKDNKLIKETRFLEGEKQQEYVWDELGNLIYKNGDLLERTNLYNSEGILSKGNLIYQKDSDGREIWYDGSVIPRRVKEKNPDGSEEQYRNGRLIYKKDSEGKEEWFDWTQSGVYGLPSICSYENSEGNKWKLEFDFNGNVTSHIVDGIETVKKEVPPANRGILDANALPDSIGLILLGVVLLAIVAALVILAFMYGFFPILFLILFATAPIWGTYLWVKFMKK